VKYVGETIEKLRRYIAEKDSRHVLEEVDTLLLVDRVPWRGVVGGRGRRAVRHGPG
jgi:hypothetical protein